LIHSYLRDNNDAKLGLAATIIPPPADIASDSNRYGDESSGQSAGSLIVAAMTGRKDSVEADPLRTWFAASLLSVLLHNNDDCKQLALGYKLKQQANSDGEGVEEDAMPLLDELAYQCSNYSKKLGTQLSNLAQVVVAYLSILAVWLYRHPHTVARFLDEGANYQFLVHIISGSMPAPRLVQGLASFLLGIAYEFDIDPSTNVTRESLYPILRKQASVDQMLLQVQSLHKDPIFSMARTIFLFPNKIVEMDPTEVYFDTTITEILVDHFEVFRRQVVTDPNNPSPLPLQFSQTQMSAAIAVEDGAPPPTASATTTTATQSVASTLSSPMVARAVSPSDHLQGASPSMIYQAEVEALKKKLTTRNAKITKLERTINDLKSQLAVAAIEQQQQHQSEGQPQQYQDSIANLQRELDSTNAKLMDVERRYAESLDQISQLNQRLSEAELHLQTKENEWLSDLQLLEDRLEESEALNRQLQEQLEHTSIPAAATTSTTSHDDAQTVDRLTKQFKELETTQEDLMLLLGDQTEKIDNYRQRLRQLGQTVSDSEDGNDDNDDDDNNNA
ncbi:Vesicle-mediated ER to Golgi transport protein, partial [Spiromyces aspiralis]